MLWGHGDERASGAKPIRANFSSNVRRDERLLEELRAHLFSNFSRSAGTYPEVCAESLAEAVAEHEGVKKENIFITNGATAAIYLLAQRYRGSASCVVIPTFSEYEDAALQHGHRLNFATREAFMQGAISSGELLWLCNPNNPTGEVFPRTQLLGLIDRSPSQLHLIDTAYQELCDADPLRASDAVERENLLLVKSLTKVFPIPGLRLGYTVGPGERIRSLSGHCVPWSVNGLAIAAGQFLLPHRERVVAAAREERLEAQRLRCEIDGLAGFQSHSTSTHFFLVEMKEPASAQLKTWLLEQDGLLVRDAANFRGLDRRFIRIAAQTPEENRWLVEALARWTPLS